MRENTGVRDRSSLDPATWRAVEQLRLAYENRVRAWIATSISLITFGFSASRFSDFLRPESDKGNYLLGMQAFALTLVVVGLASLVLGVIENRNDLRTLATMYQVKKRSLEVYVATIVAALGIFALVAMIVRP
jgi:putative membrane protein